MTFHVGEFVAGSWYCPCWLTVITWNNNNSVRFTSVFPAMTSQTCLPFKKWFVTNMQ